MIRLGLLVAVLAASQIAAQPIEFTAEKWDLQNAEVKDHLGRRALRGSAALKGATFENGVIEFDLAADHGRSYPGVLFRVLDPDNYERVYLRPHRAGHYSDAIQYLPAFNGSDAWQLYNGDGFTAGVTLPVNEWVHVRIEVKGVQARVFVGGAPQPALVIRELRRGNSRGGLALLTPRDANAYFSNFSYTNSDDLKFDPPPSLYQALGVITNWSLSQPLRPAMVDFEKTPAAQGLAVEWRPATAEPAGLLDIARYVKPFASGASCIFAKTILRANQRETRQFAFGYSDSAAIFLNGRLVFRGSSAYRERDGSFLGVAGLYDSVYLPLEKGDNELMVLVSDQLGGWGLQFRDMSATYQHKSLTRVWEIAHKLRTPESAAYDAKRNVLYVSNFQNDGNESLAKVGLDGKILALDWVTGLQRPTGVRIHNDKVYVVERTGVAEIDIETARILRRFPIADPGLLNDLTIHESGAIYVSDSFRARILKIENGKVETWLEGPAIERPNGMLVEKGRLLVGCGASASIVVVDLATKQTSTLVKLEGSPIMDGLVSDGRGGYLFSDFTGRVYHATAAGEKTLLLETIGPQRRAADFEYIPEKGLLIIPGLADNRLTAYRYQ